MTGLWVLVISVSQLVFMGNTLYDTEKDCWVDKAIVVESVKDAECVPLDALLQNQEKHEG
jgi:hypothetical protein